ncbi:MAG TPA: Rrf2 family transcriptional regulator [Bacteroidota bacterium]|nr:Rrf2 family transcriptional regulator [Bacteroidota bacterium]
MLKLSKKVEYGLIAMRHVAAGESGRVTTAKEIAERYKLPYELLAKVMQKLAKRGFIVSHQGVYGGYTLAKGAGEISISSIIDAIEGQLPAIAQCIAESPDSCSIYDNCTIKNPLGKIQTNIDTVFRSMKLSEIV